MPVALSYPGVYVEELPSSVHTITGVATSITAFVGRAARGPTDTAVTIFSFGDFQTQFGGLWSLSALGFAVRDFFLNGGTQAVIVRVYNADTSTPTPSTTMLIPVGNMSFQAASPGQWGVGLRVVTDQNNITDAIAATVGPGLTAADLFNLTVTDTGSGAVEKYANLTVKNSPARVDQVLMANSMLLAYTSASLPMTVTIGQDALTGLQGTLTTAQAQLLADQIAGKPAATITADQAAVAAAQTTLNNTVNAYLNLPSGGVTETPVSDGLALTMTNFNIDGSAGKTGIYALENVEIFNLLCIPPYLNDSPFYPPYPPAPTVADVDPTLVSAAAAYCQSRRAVLIVDAPPTWDSSSKAVTQFNDTSTDYVGTRSNYAAIYYPRLLQQNPLQNNQYQVFAACGAIAGMIAQTDGQRGVWKAPAGQETSLVNAPSLAVQVTDTDSGQLNPLGVNCLRSFSSSGRVIWGARTLAGSDQLADQYKYLPVRRTALYIESSLYYGLQWAVFEPNDTPLWAQIRLNVTAFMQTMFLQGAFQGTSPQSAYFVKCDSETTTQADINLGIVNVVVGFAPLQPAEFVVIQIQQIAGQLDV